MRKLPLVGQGSVLALMVLAITASSTGFAAGPLGAVEIKRGAPIEIRALLSESAVPSVSPLIATAMELAIEDYGRRAAGQAARGVLYPELARVLADHAQPDQAKPRTSFGADRVGDENPRSPDTRFHRRSPCCQDALALPHQDR